MRSWLPVGTPGTWACQRVSGTSAEHRARPRLADTLLTPQERAERAEQARAALQQWNGYAPSADEEQELDAELYRRLAEATGR